MKLLREYVDIGDIDILKEEVEIDGEKKKEYYLKGPFLEANILNKNGRKYMKETLEREVEKYNIDFIKTNRSLGELEHPESCQVNLDRVSHRITELYMDGNIGYGVAKLIDTPMGRIAKTLVDENILLGMSSRGIGTLEGDQVEDDYNFLTEDIVHQPSAHSAFVEGILENKEFIIGKGGKIVEVAIQNLKKSVEKKSNKYEHKEMSSLMLEYMMNFIQDINKKII